MVKYSNHTGSSLAEAIRITGASSHFESVDAEYHYITEHYGTKDTDYTIEEQHLICDKNRYYDIVKLKLINGTRTAVFFDITESYGKFVINPQ
jgi:hypothetical protein